MERQWSLVAVLLLAVQARANPWRFGEDHPNFRVIFQISGQIWPFSYNTRQILTIPPCMTLKYVWVKVSNTLGFTPSVKFHRTLNVVSITYGLLQHTGSNYDILVKGFRTPNCNPGVQKHETGSFPYRLKGTAAQKTYDGLQRQGQGKFSGLDDDLKNKKYGYNNDSDDKHDAIKESYGDMSNELEEVGNGKKKSYMIFIITGNAANQQATGDNSGDAVYDRGSVKVDNGDDHGLDYGNGKDSKYKSSKFIGIGEYSGGKEHAKSDEVDRGIGNAKGVSYRGIYDNRHGKMKANSDRSAFKSDDRNSMVSGYDGSSTHDINKTVSLGYGKGYGSSSNDENDQGDLNDEDSETYKHTKNINGVGNIKGSQYRGSNHEENYKGSLYDGDVRYVGNSGDANNKENDGRSGLHDDYLDIFDIGNRNQPDTKGKDIRLFCNDYFRTYNGHETKNLAVDKKIIDYCLFQDRRSKF